MSAKWPTVWENLEAGQAQILLVVHTSDRESLEAGYSEIVVIVHTANMCSHRRSLGFNLINSMQVRLYVTHHYLRYTIVYNTLIFIYSKS